MWTPYFTGICLYGHSCNFINNYKKPANSNANSKQTSQNVKKVNPDLVNLDYENVSINNEEFVTTTKFEIEDSVQELTPRKRILKTEDKKET